MIELKASVFEVLAHVEFRAGQPDAWRGALQAALEEHTAKGNIVEARRVQDELERGFPGPG